MRRIKLLISIFIAFAIVAFMVIWFSRKLSQNRPPKINSFAECVKAGYPVMESYPRQCRTPSGQFFVEEVIPERR